MKKEIIEIIDCSPDWQPLVKFALQWIKDAVKYEEQYRKDCTDYDGAMEIFTGQILDCAKNLDLMNKRMSKESEAA